MTKIFNIIILFIFLAALTVVCVKKNDKVTGVTLDQTTLTVVVGTPDTLVATIAPEKAINKNVTWSSSDATVATVDNGVVTALKAGTATITATSVANKIKKATCAVTVRAATCDW